MLNAVLDYIEGRIENNFREVCEQTNDPVERLHMFLARQLKLIKESPAIPTVVFSQGFFSEDPVRRGKVHHIFGQFKNRMTATLKWGQKNGSIRRDIKAETILPFWVGIIQTGALFYHLSAGEYDLESHGKRTWKVFQQIIDPTPNVKKK
jgi:hypothetical protein